MWQLRLARLTLDLTAANLLASEYSAYSPNDVSGNFQPPRQLAQVRYHLSTMLIFYDPIVRVAAFSLFLSIHHLC